MLESIGIEIALKFLGKHWKVIIMALLMGAVFFSVQSCKKYQDELFVTKNNYEAELEGANQKITKQVLSTKQLKKYYEAELAILKDSLSIKPKEVTRLQVIKTVEHDTVVSVIRELQSNFHVAEFNKGCTKGTFVWVDGDSLGTFTITNNNSFIIVDHWERQRLFDWNWAPKWGKKFGKVSVVNTCSNDTILENKVIQIDG